MTVTSNGKANFNFYLSCDVNLQVCAQRCKFQGLVLLRMWTLHTCKWLNNEYKYCLSALSFCQLRSMQGWAALYCPASSSTPPCPACTSQSMLCNAKFGGAASFPFEQCIIYIRFLLDSSTWPPWLEEHRQHKAWVSYKYHPFV